MGGVDVIKRYLRFYRRFNPPMKAEKNVAPCSSAEISMNSSMVWAWSIEPGPMQMLGIPPLERCAASENHGAPAR